MLKDQYLRVLISCCPFECDAETQSNMSGCLGAVCLSSGTVGVSAAPPARPGSFLRSGRGAAGPTIHLLFTLNVEKMRAACQVVDPRARVGVDPNLAPGPLLTGREGSHTPTEAGRKREGAAASHAGDPGVRCAELGGWSPWDAGVRSSF